MVEEIYCSKSDKRKEFTLKILDIYKDQIKGKVFIHPNQVSHEPYPTTTHLETLETVITHLQNKGYEISCGDGHGIDLSKKNIESKIKNICKNHGIKFLNLYKEPMQRLKSPRGFKIKMSIIPMKSDTIISLPILKSHPHFHMTGALKMVVGYFSGGERIKMHMKIIKNRWKMLAEGNWFLMKQENSPSRIFIMDAVKSMIKANEFRHGGKKIDLGYMFGGIDPVALDIHGFKILKPHEPKYSNKEYKYIKYINFAIDYGLGTSEYKVKEINLN
ncbi:MAG: DUF362 domain-containing protein [Candidatus Helarchaeota archaeon]